MKKSIKIFFVTGKLIIIIFYFSLTSFAQETGDKQAEEQYKLRRYEEIKKNKEKEYNKGVYNDDKKDYVNNWIGEDINYQKRVIKLKRDYRVWAEGKISRKEEVIFMDYEPLRTLTRVEKQILLEYHNKLLGKDEKKIPTYEKKGEKKKIKKKNIIKKPADEAPVMMQQITAFQPDNISTAENTENRHFILYLLLGIGGFLVIAGTSILFYKKLYNKKRSKKLHKRPQPKKK